MTFIAHPYDKVFHVLDLFPNQKKGRVGTALPQTVKQSLGCFAMGTVIEGEGNVARRDSILHRSDLGAVRRSKREKREKQQTQKTSIAFRNDHLRAILCTEKTRKNRADL